MKRLLRSGGAVVALAPCLCFVMGPVVADPASAREPRRESYLPMREVPAGFTEAMVPEDYADLRAASAAVDTYCIVWYDFEQESWQGWTAQDNTAQPGVFWHVDDFAGLGGGTYGRLVPIEGTKSMWCGARPGADYYLCAWEAAPGYGNGWEQHLSSDAIPFRGALTLSFHALYDAEPEHDRTHIEYWGGPGAWIPIAQYDGAGEAVVAHTLYLAQAATKLRFRFESDGARSDQDGLYDSDGAFAVDSVTVSDEVRVIDFEDFEAAGVGDKAAGIWSAGVPCPYGDFTGLAQNLLDKDPCGWNFATQIVFHEGSPWMSVDYPGLPVTPFCTGPGGVEDPCQDVSVRSPPIDLTRYSTSCDETQDADIPPAERAKLGGAVLSYTVYRDLPLRNLVFYNWSVRQIIGGCPGPWLDRGFFYYGADRAYICSDNDVSDLISGEWPVQIRMSVFDMCDAWYLYWGGACAEHTPAPYLDNVRLYRYSTVGPQWFARAVDLFQDTFPTLEFDMESWCRADMACDLRPAEDPVIDPGDSVVITCQGALSPLDTLPDGQARVYCHVNSTYIGTGTKPDLAGPQLAGTYGTYVGEDGGWTVLHCPQALTGAGNPASDTYMIDLNDSLFTRGYMIEYYFRAYDQAGFATTWPEHAQRPAGKRLEFTCLPTLRSGTLYVDDFDGRGTLEGMVQAYFDPTFGAMFYEPVDRYDVNGPSTSVSNGIGAHAHSCLFNEAYETVIFDSGDLTRCTISDGTERSDKSDDCRLLIEFLRNSEHRAGLLVMGDGVAYDLSQSASPGALELMSAICGVALAHDSYFELTGGYEAGGLGSPLVTGMPGTLFQGLQYYAFGGCPLANDFDVIETTGPGAYCLRYPDYGSTQCYAGIYTHQSNDFAYPLRTVWIGHSFMYIRDPCLSFPLRNQLLDRVALFFENDVNSNLTGDETPPAATTLSRCRPNPFNPATTIAFTLREKGPVTLKVYDVSGRLVRTLVDGTREAGRYEAVWDGRNDGGRSAASGIYFCRMEAADFERTEKMVLLR